MWRTLVLVEVACTLQLAVGALRADEPTHAAQKEKSTVALVVGEPIRHANLTIFPVTTREARNADRFITLDEGIKSGKIEIRELGGAASGANRQGANPAAANGNEVDDPFGDVKLPPDDEARIDAEDQRQSSTTAHGDDPQDAATTAAGSCEAPSAVAEVPSGNDSDQQPAAQQVGQAAQAENSELDALFDDGEAGAGNDVNHLRVTNHADKPLYLMPGEIIVGGAEDRTIAQEYVIPPDGKPVVLAVFCVEHGRWGARDYGDMEMVNQSLALQGLTQADAAQAATQTKAGKFIGSIGNLNKPGRVAVQESRDQGAVWDEVGKENAKAGVKAGSGAFTGQYAEKEVAQRLDAYIAKLQEPVASANHVVGVIVAVNGKVDSADVLESTPLFHKLWPKLLKSYALDAANALDDSKAEQQCTRDNAIAFLKDLQTAAAESSETESADTPGADTPGTVALSKHTSSRLSTFSAFDKSGPAASGAMGGGFGGGIHSSGFSK